MFVSVVVLIIIRNLILIIVFCEKNETQEVRLKEFLNIPQSLLYLLSFTVRRWPGVIIHTVTALQFSMPIRYRTLDY